MSDLQVLVQPAAIADLDRHADYIASDNPAAAVRFLDAASATFQFLADMPLIGVNCGRFFASPRAQGIRLWRVKGFANHQILYHVSDSTLLIIRVIHAAQDKQQFFEG